MDSKVLNVGIDIGSTTAKIVIMDNGRVVYEKYERHYSQVRQKTLELLKKSQAFLENSTIKIAISGSAGLGVAEKADIDFVQEVYSTFELIKTYESDVDCVIELGGEDAKIIFLKGGVDERMNGSCAGGTGAFIDQMATLLNLTPDELDSLSLQYEKVYPIASRCGVFAKTDIQPLINQGVLKSDIAMSIYHAVVNQTIAGLAQGRKISGKVMFLGGPLYYNRGLRKAFMDILKLDDKSALFPEYSLYAVAMGAALFAKKSAKEYSYEELTGAVEKTLQQTTKVAAMPPLFENDSEYEEFITRHNAQKVDFIPISSYKGKAYLGIDCGSTTTKIVLINEKKEILWSYYNSNKGNPVSVVKAQLEKMYEEIGADIEVMASAVTGYGEELIKAAFHIDRGIVETMAHFMAAKHFEPKVDFILDIGGQDIKCIKIKNDSVDSIMLNEACSSGCGSFIETFAKSMGYSTEEFATLGIKGRSPVDLGSRCTVFMNSSIKQAQKDGVSVEDISAGISASVVKNAIYKVIRANSPTELGENIVVQGGTFLNNAVLRAFEKEIGHNAVRPSIAGLMGAYGAALYAMGLNIDKTTTMNATQLTEFTHSSKASVCSGCTNHCSLTINTFSDGSKYISGNRCEKMKTGNKADNSLNLYAWKRDYLAGLNEQYDTGTDIKVGIPLGLGIYDLAPLWHGIFKTLGIQVIFSDMSSRNTYLSGQDSIPSDTICYPAKLMHGHIQNLCDKKVDYIFVPCLTYNLDENAGDNHYNCPVVAYYPEVIKDNMDIPAPIKYLAPFLNICDDKEFARELKLTLSKSGFDYTEKEYLKAIRSGFAEYNEYKDAIRKRGAEIIEEARRQNKKIMVLAGRPYHVDSEIGHGIDLLACSLGFAVITEESVCHNIGRVKTAVLNQWTYHSRLYSAAEYVTKNKDMYLVQLVSFGCGIDAITTDEVRSIMERSQNMYTQIKIDEINNLSAVNIRLRSLIGAIEMRQE